MYVEFSTTLLILGEGDLLKREDALLVTSSMCGGEKRGNTRVLASPRRADAASFCSFVLLQENSDLFCFGNIPKNPVRKNGVESG
jgi:hypothetical protein